MIKRPLESQDQLLYLTSPVLSIILTPSSATSQPLQNCQTLQWFLSPLYIVVMECLTARTPRIPYHTSALSEEDWVNELLSGHPQCIQVELGVYRGTFTVLVKAMEDLNIHSSCHVSIEEQVSIFLYIVVTGLTCTHVGEHFQQSSSTITK